MEFEFDSRKAAANAAKHGVSFEEAASVLRDALSESGPDPANSDREDRFLIVGLAGSGRLLVVAVTHRRDAIRIISARELTARERRAYERQRAP
ncbi:MAG: BrnT family toxin [Chloroflexota bacterium]